MGLIFQLCLPSHLMPWQLMLPSSTPEVFFCISCSWEHQRKVWSTKQLQLCYLLATLYQEGEQVLEMKWQNMQSKIQKKEGFWTNLLYQFGHGGGKGERTKENELKQEEKAQYLHHLDLVTQPNRINRRIMSFRVGFWEVISSTCSKLSGRKANLAFNRCTASHGRPSSHLAT